MKLTALFAAVAMTLAAGEVDAAPAGVSGDGVLVDQDGMTLYIFDKDEPGVSTCYGGCAESWPPFTAKADAVDEGGFTRVTRKDGSAQWAYQGRPLYYWAGDSRPGDTNGDGVGGVWHILK